MARKPNYGFERRERERKKAEKKRLRQEAKEEKAKERSEGAAGLSEDEAAPQDEI